jgi:hypothetical protein
VVFLQTEEVQVAPGLKLLLISRLQPTQSLPKHLRRRCAGAARVVGYSVCEYIAMAIVKCYSISLQER